jgi:hypothetical protein
MEQNTINLDALTITELKALAYDRIVIAENTSRELSMINQTIQRKIENNIPVEESIGAKNDS